jgi:hypothetical protein
MGPVALFFSGWAVCLAVVFAGYVFRYYRNRDW